MSDQVLVNGNLLSRASCTLKMNGEPFYAWQTIEFGDKRERAYGYGANRSYKPLGKTKGKYTPDPLVIGFLEHASKAVLDSLGKLASDGKSVGEPSVLWTLSIDEPGVASVLNEIEGCTLAELSASVEETAEGIVEKLTFMPMGVKRNGLSLYDQSTGT